MKDKKIIKIIALALSLTLAFEQSGLAQIAGQLDISGYMAQLRNTLTQDKFRPLHLRYLSYDPAQNNFQLLLDKGTLKNLKPKELESSTETLLKYFLVGVTLPNDTFWVNLRPDSPDNIIDDYVAQTDVGKVFLEADLQLKKDTARFTSPETPEGREYWDKLYKKAGEIFGNENVSIPTLTRPWIVPGEIIIRETDSNAYIYKATLKVMLEEDYLKGSSTYNFTDERLKELNAYSSELIRSIVIPKITQEVNTSKKYAPLRQAYYSLILAQWFKDKFYGKSGTYSYLIDRRELTGLSSEESWSKDTYFQAYQKSFNEGEYNIKQPAYTPYGQVIRSYFSGGISITAEPMREAMRIGAQLQPAAARGALPTELLDKGPLVRLEGGTLDNPLPKITEVNAAQEEPAQPPAQQGDLIHEQLAEGTKSIPESHIQRYAIAEKESTEQYVERIHKKYGVEIHLVSSQEELQKEATNHGISRKAGDGFGYYDKSTDTMHVFIVAGNETNSILMAHEITEALARGSIGGVAQAGAATGQTGNGPAMEAKDLSGGVNLEEYIALRKLWLTEKKQGAQSEPQEFVKSARKLYPGARPRSIESLITRQAETIEQSILELVSNASDAQTGRSSPIGRFGMGALQMLAFVIDKDKPGAYIMVDTATAAGEGRRVTFFKGKGSGISFTARKIEKSEKGTTVRVKLPRGLDKNLRKSIENKFLRERLNLFTQMPVYLNGELLNPLDEYAYLNGDTVRYSYPQSRIDVTIKDNEITVEDRGSGMSDEVIFDKYLIPRLGENSPIPQAESREEIEKEEHLFYKVSRASAQKATCKVTFQVSGINIQSFSVEGQNLPQELVVQLPSSTRLPVSRNKIEIDRTTADAIRALARKVIDRQPLHQLVLINGLMQAARLLDQNNLRVENTPSLVETAKKELIPFVLQLQKTRVVLPNNEFFHQIEAPAETVYLDEDLTYNLSPEQIPGAKKVPRFFKEGSFKGAFTAPFKADSRLAYIPFGPYLILNRSFYEKHKNSPLVYNLRLNFYIGYGKEQASKGWLLPYKEEEAAAREEIDVLPLLKSAPLLKSMLTETQKQRLKSYLTANPTLQPQLERLFARLEEFLKRVPEPMRLRVAGKTAGTLPWGSVLFSADGIEELTDYLSSPNQILLPDENFLNIHSGFFLNEDNQQFLFLYLRNLLYAGSAPVAKKENPAFHALLSQVYGSGILRLIDEEIMEAVENVFANANLDDYKDCFSAIRKAQSNASLQLDEKRLILRWLRIYKSNPRAAKTFEAMLDKKYKREAKAGQARPAEATLRILDTSNLSNNLSNNHFAPEGFTGAFLNGDKRKPIFFFNSKTDVWKFLTVKLDESCNYEDIALLDMRLEEDLECRFTGAFSDENKKKPIFIISTKEEGSARSQCLVTLDTIHGSASVVAPVEELVTGGYTGFNTGRKLLVYTNSFLGNKRAVKLRYVSPLDKTEEITDFEIGPLGEEVKSIKFTGAFRNGDKKKPIFDVTLAGSNGPDEHVPFVLDLTTKEALRIGLSVIQSDYLKFSGLYLDKEKQQPIFRTDRGNFALDPQTEFPREAFPQFAPGLDIRFSGIFAEGNPQKPILVVISPQGLINFYVMDLETQEVGAFLSLMDATPFVEQHGQIIHWEFSGAYLDREKKRPVFIAVTDDRSVVLLSLDLSSKKTSILKSMERKSFFSPLPPRPKEVSYDAESGILSVDGDCWDFGEAMTEAPAQETSAKDRNVLNHRELSQPLPLAGAMEFRSILESLQYTGMKDKDDRLIFVCQDDINIYFLAFDKSSGRTEKIHTINDGACRGSLPYTGIEDEQGKPLFVKMSDFGRYDIFRFNPDTAEVEEVGEIIDTLKLNGPLEISGIRYSGVKSREGGFLFLFDFEDRHAGTGGVGQVIVDPKRGALEPTLHPLEPEVRKDFRNARYTGLADGQGHPIFVKNCGDRIVFESFDLNIGAPLGFAEFEILGFHPAEVTGVVTNTGIVDEQGRHIFVYSCGNYFGFFSLDLKTKKINKIAISTYFNVNRDTVTSVRLTGCKDTMGRPTFVSNSRQGEVWLHALDLKAGQVRTFAPLHLHHTFSANHNDALFIPKEGVLAMLMGDTEIRMENMTGGSQSSVSFMDLSEALEESRQASAEAEGTLFKDGLYERELAKLEENKPFQYTGATDSLGRPIFFRPFSPKHGQLVFLDPRCVPARQDTVYQFSAEQFGFPTIDKIQYTGIEDSKGRLIFTVSSGNEFTIFFLDPEDFTVTISKQGEGHLDCEIEDIHYTGTKSKEGLPILFLSGQKQIKFYELDPETGRLEPLVKRSDISARYTGYNDKQNQPIFYFFLDNRIEFRTLDPFTGTSKKVGEYDLEAAFAVSVSVEYTGAVDVQADPIFAIRCRGRLGFASFNFETGRMCLIGSPVACSGSIKYLGLKDEEGRQIFVFMPENGEAQLKALDLSKGEFVEIRKYQPRFAPDFAKEKASAVYLPELKVLMRVSETDGVTTWPAHAVFFWEFMDAVRSGKDQPKPELPAERLGFACLSPEEDLSGLPPLVRVVVRFLKEEKVSFVEKGNLEARGKDWQEETEIVKDKPISVALLNYIFERYANEIIRNPRLSAEEFIKLLSRAEGIDLSAYSQIIKSGIEGQDRTERTWVREVGVQNPRDAVRKEAEEGRLSEDKRRIIHTNFIDEDNNWVYSIKDPVGMTFWQLVRYYFPLDESSKHYLYNAGNLGQGNYTLFADFDEIFIRTSTGDGNISEIVIRNNGQGPEVVSWKVFKGNYKGTEIRRIRKQESSDPQLESLFIQEALERYAGAIADTEILYNASSIREEIQEVSQGDIGGGWGRVALARAKDATRRRVIQDGIFVKDPDAKELALVPPRILEAFERYGGLHIVIPRQIRLNIPRNGYAEEQKFIHRLRVAVLHAVMKAVLRDHLEKGAPIPGMPEAYFGSPWALDNPGAMQVSMLMYEGKYDEVTEEMLEPFLKDLTKFFELLSHIPFTSANHKGETTLHFIREQLMEKAKLKQARREAAGFKQQSLEETFKGTEFKGNFRDQLVESAGSSEALQGGKVGGFIAGLVESKRAEKKDAQKFLDELPKGARERFEALCIALLKAIGVERPRISYFYGERDIGAAHTSGSEICWNLYHFLGRIKQLYELSENQKEEWLRQLREADKNSFLWKIIETVVHESQHLPEFEAPGDHTHHSDETIDAGFAARMGRALDRVIAAIDINEWAKCNFSVQPPAADSGQEANNLPPYTGSGDSSVHAALDDARKMIAAGDRELAKTRLNNLLRYLMSAQETADVTELMGYCNRLYPSDLYPDLMIEDIPKAIKDAQILLRQTAQPQAPSEGSPAREESFGSYESAPQHWGVSIYYLAAKLGITKDELMRRLNGKTILLVAPETDELPNQLAQQLDKSTIIAVNPAFKTERRGRIHFIGDVVQNIGRHINGKVYFIFSSGLFNPEFMYSIKGHNGPLEPNSIYVPMFRAMKEVLAKDGQIITSPGPLGNVHLEGAAELAGLACEDIGGETVHFYRLTHLKGGQQSSAAQPPAPQSTTEADAGRIGIIVNDLRHFLKKESVDAGNLELLAWRILVKQRAVGGSGIVEVTPVDLAGLEIPGIIEEGKLKVNGRTLGMMGMGGMGQTEAESGEKRVTENIKSWVRDKKGGMVIKSAEGEDFEFRYFIGEKPEREDLEDGTYGTRTRHCVDVFHDGKRIGYAHFRVDILHGSSGKISEAKALMWASFAAVNNKVGGVSRGEAIYVDPQYQEMGVGRSLMGVVARLAREMGADSLVEIEVLDQDFMKALGFRLSSSGETAYLDLVSKKKGSEKPKLPEVKIGRKAPPAEPLEGKHLPPPLHGYFGMAPAAPDTLGDVAAGWAETIEPKPEAALPSAKEPFVEVTENVSYKLPSSDSRTMQAELVFCLAVAGYNKNTGERFMAHLLPDRRTSGDSKVDERFEQIFEKLSGRGWRVTVISTQKEPDKDTEIDAEEIKEYLLQNKNITGILVEKMRARTIVSIDGKGRVRTDIVGEPSKSGGIDFRSLPIVTQPLSKPAMRQPPLSKPQIPVSWLDSEWREIENMLNGGIIPSTERLKGYLENCSGRECFDKDLGKVLSCIADILRLEEERCLSTEESLKALLVLLESDKPAAEFAVSLNRIKVLPQEPQTIDAFVVEEK